MKKLALVIAGAVVFLLGPVGGALGGTPNLLFPDIIPFIDEGEVWLQNWDISGGRLRVQTVFANIGDGLFQIRQDQEGSGGATTPVTQRVFIDTDNGPNFQDFPVNSTVNFHGSHGHLHFEDFAEFQLLEATTTGGVLGVGNLVTNEVKTSFSLRDSIRLPGPDWVNSQSFPSTNNGEYQDVSVGFGDRYSHGTSGQSMSLAGVSFGPLYWLRQIVDPTNVIRETNENNNMVQILIDLNAQGQTFFNLDGTFKQPGDAIPAVPGDLNGDGTLDIIDWTAFLDRFDSDLTGLNDEMALMQGDLDLDRLHTILDVDLFRQLYDDANGAGAFAAIGAVPEPASVVLIAAGLFLCAIFRKRPRSVVSCPN